MVSGSVGWWSVVGESVEDLSVGWWSVVGGRGVGGGPISRSVGRWSVVGCWWWMACRRSVVL